MALTFPLPIADFFDPLPVANVTFRPQDARTFTETGGGELIPAMGGKPLWTGQVAIDIDTHARIAAFEAKLALLERAGASFLIYDRRKPFPSYDPGGTLISGASPVIAALNANNREIDLSGLPAGYQLTSGDLIGWTYGSGPTRYALHRILTGGTANGSGALADIELSPWLEPGTSPGAAVTLVRPPCKAVLDQADYGGGRSVITQGGTFTWKQTFR